MDIAATVLLSLVCLGAGVAALFVSPFLVMATDSANAKPRLGALGWAFAVTWGGAAAGVIGAGIGIYRAARHGTTMWIWPALGVALIGVTFLLGGWLATKVVRKLN